MEEGRFLSATENPRNLIGFSNGNSNSSGKALPGEVPVTKPILTILDRFKAMLKEREQEIRVSPDDDSPRLSTKEIVRLYELILAELTLNSKPIITDLTIIAGEQREHGEGIADAICARIVEVPVEQKMPSLYLLDSIVKNIGREYIRYFSSRLPEVFCEAYRQVHPNLYPAMRHLFKTWSTVFPPSVLCKIEAQLQFSPSADHQSSGPTSVRASESPRPTHGIHINPKYLEARRQFEHSSVDSVGAQRLSSTDHTDHTSFSLGAEKLLPSSAAKLAKSSPFRVEHATSLSPPLVDEYAVVDSPRRVAERASPSHLGFEYGLGRMMRRGENSRDRPRNQWSDGNYRQFKTSYSNGVELQGPRALINAYGNDERKQTHSNQPPNIALNGTDNKVGTKTWQNTEEEEFDWEDMSPALVNCSQSNNLLSSFIPHESSMKRPGKGTYNSTSLDIDFKRSNHSSQMQISVNDPSVILEDAVPTVRSGHGSSSKIMGLRAETTQFLGSRHPQDARHYSNSIAQSSQHPFNLDGSSRNFHMHASSSIEQKPFPAHASSGIEQKPLINSFPNADVQLRGSTVASRMGAANVDSWKSEAVSAAVPPSTGAWPVVNLQKSHTLPILPPHRQQKQIKRQFDLMSTSNTVVNQGLNKSFLPAHQFNSVDNKALSSIKKPSFPIQQAGLPLNSQNHEQVPSLQPQLLLSQNVRQNLLPSAAVSMPQLAPPLSTHGYTTLGHNTTVSKVLPNPIPVVHPSIPILNTPNSSMHLQGGGFPPLPPGPRPPTSQMVSLSQNPISVTSNSQSGNAFSGLISSLMAQGLISLTKQSPVQDSVGLEFNPDVLKVRHESAITALYAELPRQCKTCGLRFKSQEEHSSHMDWHVTKNRISKNRKQKPSRRWFVSVNMWLTGTEAFGTDAVPGFLPAESVVEKKEDEEYAVPADEDQNACALCGEPFDDFYSDETDEWMYKGAVYMNAPSGSTAGMDSSHLGPIVHAKCRSESSVVSADGFGQNEGVYTEDGSQRKRLRS